VTSVSGGSFSTTFAYDPNGNQTSGLGRTISYSSYNKPASITQGARTISFLDDTDHQRFEQVTPEGGPTLYIAAFGVLAELLSPGATGQQWTDYLSVGNAKVGKRVIQTAAETLTTRYFHTDNLGSISVITNESGVVQERLSYDAWGKRRFPNGTDDPTDGIASQTTRGFTGEEELSVSGLVHLNGRVYDPLLARMTSADPTVPNAMNAQAWNRYSYVGNDPLAFTDPNGFGFWSSFVSFISAPFNAIGNVISSAFNAVSSVFHSVANFLVHNPVVRAIVQIGINVALVAIGIPPIAAAFTSAAITTGLSGGNLGQILKASAIAGLTALAFNAVGDFTGHTPDFGTPAAYAENIAGHALVGCASSAASGGSCESGALSGAVGSALSPITNDLFPNASTDLGQRIGGTIVEATAGGLASVAGGGKFANGAVTGAFGYMFNAMGGRIVGGIVGGIVEGALGVETGPGDALLIAHGIYAGGDIGSALEDFVKDIFVSSSLYPEAAAHIRDAIDGGQPNVLTIDRDGASANRAAAIGGIDKVPGMQLDEYPPAMFSEGGMVRAFVRSVHRTTWAQVLVSGINVVVSQMDREYE
jgi:RHS repeat-associated protein